MFRIEYNILHFWVFSACLSLMSCLPNEQRISSGFYRMFHDVSKPLDLSGCWSLQANKKLGCISLCKRNSSCIALFVELSDTNNGDVWSCLLCQDTWSVDTLPAGQGSYAISAMGLARGQAPAISSAVLTKVDMELGKMAASYDCTSNGKFFKLAFDETTGKWPPLSAACQKTICTVESVFSMMVTVKISTGVHIVEPFCKSDERSNGHVECYNGKWTQFGGLRTLCISRTCKRTNSFNRAVYQGSVSTTKNGKTCQEWRKLTPHPHTYTGSFFLEDYNSLMAAGNTCRDPGNDGYLWCYTLGTSIFNRYERCSIPECV